MADRADELYALAPGDFTAARDALAKELRAGGDRDGADAVKRLRKPTVVAWAINHASRVRGEELRELLDAGAALRRAHEALMSGSGDRAALREASERERAAVGAFARAVREEAEAAGAPLADTATDKVRDTLHAAALNDDVREALEGGRLEREAEAVGDAGMLAAWSAPAGAAAKPGKASSASRSGAAGKRGSAGSGRRAGKGGDAGARSRSAPPDETQASGGRAPAEPEPKVSAAERRALALALEEAIRSLRAADREAKRAERDADGARRRMERAERAVEKARADLADAEADLEAVRDEALDAQREVREAKATLAAAQQAADAAAAAAGG